MEASLPPSPLTGEQVTPAQLPLAMQCKFRVATTPSVMLAYCIMTGAGAGTTTSQLSFISYLSV